MGVAAGLLGAVFEVCTFALLGFPSEVLAGAREMSTVPFMLTAFAMLMVGPIEELTKYLMLRIGVYGSHDFNQVFDGIVYGITIALGFSFMENIVYAIDFYTTETPTMFAALSVMRGLFSTLAHVTFTGILGYYVGMAKFSATGRFWLIAKGIIIASVLHSGYNLILVSSMPFGFIWAIVIIAACFALFLKVWDRPDVRMIWQYVPPTPTPEVKP